MKFVLVMAMLASVNAFAATDSEYAPVLDAGREGNLRQLVIEEFQRNNKIACDTNEAARFDAIRLASGSAHKDKGTYAYEYEATYLVIQKCYSGSTYAGAYGSLVKSSVITGSFDSVETKKGKATTLTNVKFKFVKDVNLELPQGN